jgi:hypothetical protein
MKTKISLITLLAFIPAASCYADNITVTNLLQGYATQGATTADAVQGRKLWQQKFNSDRSCATCHTTDLTQSGRHVKTKKDIKPMSPSINPERLSDTKKVKKWFKRNCKWTLGRECTAQEKSDFLAYISQSSKF